MCLSIAVDRPSDVLGTGVHAGYEWVVTHNTFGYRCGYVRVPKGHPWHGLEYDRVEAEVHGGLTFSSPDKACDKGGTDDAWWLGFDFAHGGDAPDHGLPWAGAAKDVMSKIYAGRGYHAWTQAEVEAECRDLCEQAARAVLPSPNLPG